MFEDVTEPLTDFHLLECVRCDEPMYHRLLGLAGDFPLWRLWDLECGECGHAAQAWEELDVPIRFAGDGQRLSEPPADYAGEEEDADAAALVEYPELAEV